jgi:hypothetical protein
MFVHLDRSVAQWRDLCGLLFRFLAQTPKAPTYWLKTGPALAAATILPQPAYLISPNTSVGRNEVLKISSLSAMALSFLDTTTVSFWPQINSSQFL